MKSQMGLVETILLRIAAFCVDHVIKLRHRETLINLREQTELGKLRREYEKFPASRLAGIQNGKRN
jgi:hypothetical protein